MSNDNNEEQQCDAEALATLSARVDELTTCCASDNTGGEGEEEVTCAPTSVTVISKDEDGNEVTTVLAETCSTTTDTAVVVSTKDASFMDGLSFLFKKPTDNKGTMYYVGMGTAIVVGGIGIYLIARYVMSMMKQRRARIAHEDAYAERLAYNTVQNTKQLAFDTSDEARRKASVAAASKKFNIIQSAL